MERVGHLNKLQEDSFNVIYNGRNCIIVAPTGSGKTEAAVLPILEKAADSGSMAGVFALYVTPLRSLNRDMMKRLNDLCTELGVSIGVRHGDTTQSERRSQAINPPLLVITTPESIQNMLLSRRLRKSFENLRYVVVDELHELYYNKRGAQLSVALERLSELNSGFTRVGLSATIGDIKEAARYLFNKREYRVIDSSIEKTLDVHITIPEIPQRRHNEFEASFQIDDKALARIERIEDIVKTSKATLVFANTRQVVEALGSKIIYLSRLEGFDYVGIHHSSLDKDERIEIEDAFKSGRINCIIATSSLELGIDIGRIDMVVQYGSPRQANRLLQRIGRSGHREGVVSKGEIVAGSALEALESAATIISAKNMELERYSVERMPMDVMANQLSSMALEYTEIDIEKAFEIFKRTFTYSDLDAVLFRRMLAFCSDLGTVAVKDNMIVRGRRSRSYFVENISVIPDSRRFVVKRASTNRIISTLDERFVYTNLDENSTFITKGIPWSVISIEDGVVFVEQSAEVSAAVPDWEGEDIPVSRNIAERTMRMLAEPDNAHGIIDEASFASVIRFCDMQRRFFLPGGGKVFIEEKEDYAIVHAPLGKLANEFLARAAASVLGNNREYVSVKSTPYSIIIDFRSIRKRPDVEKTLRIITHQGVFSDISGIMANSEIFRYKFVHVAKLFGIVEKKAVLTRSSINRLMDFYKNTPVYEEALRDVGKNYIDRETVAEFLNGIASGNIKISFVNSGSPLSAEILKSALSRMELLSGTEIGNDDVEQVLKRFEGKEVDMLCTYCSFIYKKKINVSDLSRDKVVCGRCGSPMQCTYCIEYFESISKKRGGKRLTAKDNVSYRNAIDEAGLVSAYGDRAIVALLTYGVGRATAGRVLKMIRKKDKSFVEDVLRAQRIFIRNSRFWKRN